MRTVMETESLFRELKRNVNKGSDAILYLSGTKNRKTRMANIVARIKEDTELDWELGVIDNEEYKVEKKAIQLLEKSLENYKVF